MKKANEKSRIVRTVVMAVLAVILIPILAVNVTLIIKGSIHKNVPPDVFGIAPLAVTTGSMEGKNRDSFSEGSLIFVRMLGKSEKENLQEGDVITFRSMGAYVTHRIVAVNRDDGKMISVITKGDANNAADGAIPIANVVGKCVGSVGGLGNFAMFLQTPAGILVFVGIPVLLFIAYDVIRVVLYNRRVREEESLREAENELKDKEEEILRLRAMLDAHTGDAEEEKPGPSSPED